MNAPSVILLKLSHHSNSAIDEFHARAFPITPCIATSNKQSRSEQKTIWSSPMIHWKINSR